MESSQNFQESIKSFLIDEQQMEIKYNNFYADLDILESQSISSDLDNLQSVLNHKIGEGLYDLYYFSDHQKYSYKRNPRVSEIPTVYLLTCIKTEQLPQRKCWWKYDSIQENNYKNEESMHIKNLMNDEVESQLINFAKSNKNLILTFKQSLKNEKQEKNTFQKYKNSQKITKVVNNVIQNKWKTDYIIIKKDQLININQRKAIIKQNFYLKQNKNTNNYHPQKTNFQHWNIFIKNKFINQFKFKTLKYQINPNNHSNDNLSNQTKKSNIFHPILQIHQKQFLNLNSEPSVKSLQSISRKRKRSQNYQSQQPNKKKYQKSDILLIKKDNRKEIMKKRDIPQKNLSWSYYSL